MTDGEVEQVIFNEKSTGAAVTRLRDRDSFASLSSRAVSPAARALIDNVYAAVEQWESESRKHGKGNKAVSRGRYKRGPERARALRDVLERFVDDLLRAQHDKHKTEDATGLVFRSMSKQAYPPGEVVTWRQFKAAVDGLRGSGLLAHTKGQGRFTTAFGRHQLLAPGFSLWGFSSLDDCEMMRRESAQIAKLEMSQMACVMVPPPMPRPRPSQAPGNRRLT